MQLAIKCIKQRHWPLTIQYRYSAVIATGAGGGEGGGALFPYQEPVWYSG